ncbi:hypothetical protein F0562_005322 [Nyssa sinensis]|uniref:Exocyst complex subunit Exo70 C-terminal domain-containing protein n=1 Tax=Nyssa sinensis TaxID=561372 RepID=A0A5J5AKH3_9ASTE|nr:hypothetical protein F0562_005322 [Nyssa sinensis]
METSVSIVQVDAIQPSMTSGTISVDRRQSKFWDNTGGLLHQFNSIAIGATSIALTSTTFSSSMTFSSGPASFLTMPTIDGIQLSFESTTISDVQTQFQDKLLRGGRDGFPTIEAVKGIVEPSIGSVTISYNEEQSKTNVEDMTCNTVIRDTTANSRLTSFLDEVNYCYYGALLHKGVIDDLRSIAEKMKCTGELFKCVTTYARLRKSFLDANFKSLGSEKLSIKEVRILGGDALQEKIKQWIRTAKIFIRILFIIEKRQSEQIFGGLESGMDDECFVETIRDAATQLFDIAEALSMIRPSPERLKIILLFHKDLSNLMPDVSYVFKSKSVEIIQIRESIQICAAKILSRLVESVRMILPDFEKSVIGELSSIPVPGASIHYLTKYVMDYVGLILENKEVLTELIVSRPSTNFGDVKIPDVEYTEVEGTTPLALHLIWIIVILRFKLEEKCKYYVQASLAHLFMMNNVDYIVRQMEGSLELEEMIGADYIKKLAKDVHEASTSYQRSTLERILYCLRDEGLEGTWWGIFSWVSKSALKERLKTFNSLFGEVLGIQARWEVPNLQLREKLRLSILHKLIPAYESFLGRYRRMETERESESELLDQFDSIVIRASRLTPSSASTTYSSSITSSSGPSVAGIQIWNRSSTILDDEEQWKANDVHFQDKSIRSSSYGFPTMEAIFSPMEAINEIEPPIGSAQIIQDLGQWTTNDKISLENQLRDALTRATGIVDPSSIPPGPFKFLHEDYLCSHGALPKKTIDELRSAAESMKSHGKLFECVVTYSRVRKCFLYASFQRLGIEKLSMEEVGIMEWDALEGKIKRWIKAAKIFIRILFASEKQQSWQIFGDLETGMDDACFVKTVGDAATQLFDIAEKLSMIRQLPERLRMILLFHKDLSNLMPDVSRVFQSESMEVIQMRENIQFRAIEILSRLEIATRMILPKFEKAVLVELSTIQVPGGTIHTLTKYVMDYVSIFTDHKKILTELIVSKPSTNFEDMMIPDVEYAEVEGRTPLTLHLIWIIVSLRFNLEGKSKYYGDASLAHLFMTNNLNYIVCKIEESPKLNEMIGDDYLKKLAEDVQLAATGYQKSTLDKLLFWLRDEGLVRSWWSIFLGVSKTTSKQRHKGFNSSFQEVYQTQAGWVVPNLQLREKLRLSISNKLIPPYNSFLKRYNREIESGKHGNTYAKYSVKDLETDIMNFFASPL